MKIVHFTSGNVSGGAARGAYFLHRSLCLSGINSKFYIADRFQAESFEDINYLSNNVNNSLELDKSRHLERYILDRYPQRNAEIFSIGNGIYDDKIVEIANGADIVHLHWINDQMLSIEALNKINKPIVWTFRDMWPFTGGCHYSSSCSKYKKNCGNCDFLNSHEVNDISNWVYLRKKNNYAGIYPVALSNWLAECATASGLFQDQEIKVIPNCIDTNIFKPTNKLSARVKLKLPSEKKIITFGAINAFGDKRKGFEQLAEALIHLQDKEKYHVVTFGSSNLEILESFGIDYTQLGTINDDQKLAEIYSAADLFVAPSIEEAFGKTIIESMACGTPVIAFNATGPKDIITHEINGYLAKAYDSIDLAKGIKFIVNHHDLNEMSENAIRAVQKYYSPHIVANQYNTLYRQVINKDRSSKHSELENLDHYFTNIKSEYELFLDKEWNDYNKWYVFLNKRKELINIIGKRRVAIYGTGSFGQELFEILHYYKIQVDTFIDSNILKHGTILNDLMISSLEYCKDCFIFIASTWYQEIEDIICTNGFSKNDYIISSK